MSESILHQGRVEGTAVRSEPEEASLNPELNPNAALELSKPPLLVGSLCALNIYKVIRL